MPLDLYESEMISLWISGRSSPPQIRMALRTFWTWRFSEIFGALPPQSLRNYSQGLPCGNGDEP